VTDTYRSLSSAATAHCRPVAVLDLQLPRHRCAVAGTPPGLQHASSTMRTPG